MSLFVECETLDSLPTTRETTKPTSEGVTAQCIGMSSFGRGRGRGGGRGFGGGRGGGRFGGSKCSPIERFTGRRGDNH